MEIVANVYYEGMRCAFCKAMIVAGEHILVLMVGGVCHKPCKTRMMKRFATEKSNGND